MKKDELSPSSQEKVEKIYQMYSAMNDEKKLRFLNLILKDLEKQSEPHPDNPTASPKAIPKFLFEQNGVGALKCPHCSSYNVVKNGTKGGKQRFLCRNCGKTFSGTTNTVLFMTHHNLSTWEKYLECMEAKLSLRKSAKVCGISLRTAFFWKNKILDALRRREEEESAKSSNGS